jgi:uncharacterized membrane protein YcaP (DUF421 family)
MDKIFFESWESVVRTLIMTSLGYFTMVIILRVSGKRTLSKMNAFDLIVTIALGSCLATIALNKSVTLADGIVAFSLFIFFQFLLTWLSVRIPFVKDLITNPPTLIFYKGEFLKEPMKRERITQQEIFKASRLKGYSELDNVEMIILESTGDISIVENDQSGRIDTLEQFEKD